MDSTGNITLRDFAKEINLKMDSFTQLKRLFTKKNKWPHSRKLWL
jgi:hypothetical protein